MYFEKLFKVSTANAKTKARAMMIKVVVWLIAIIVVIMAVAKFYSYLSARYACHTQWVESSIDYKYTLRGGCLLKIDDGWIPAKNYRIGS